MFDEQFNESFDKRTEHLSRGKIVKRHVYNHTPDLIKPGDYVNETSADRLGAKIDKQIQYMQRGTIETRPEYQYFIKETDDVRRSFSLNSSASKLDELRQSREERKKKYQLKTKKNLNN